MTLQIAAVFLLLAGTLVLFALDRYPVDFVALTVLAVMLVAAPWLGLSYGDVISGFSSPATITVMAMFIISGAITQTGMINWLAGQLLRTAGRTETRHLFSIMAIVGPVSAFLNNTATVAILMPVVMGLARSQQRPPSRYLMPLSYGAQLGGVMTLIGTSTNVLAASLVAAAGLPTFGMFDFAAIGVLIFATGALYLLTIGRWLLPERAEAQALADAYQLRDYLAELTVAPGSPLANRRLNGAQLDGVQALEVSDILRDGERLGPARMNAVLQPGDVLLIQANAQQLAQVRAFDGLAGPPQPTRRRDDAPGLLEVVIAPNSWLIGGTLESTDFRGRFDCSVMAMRKHGAVIDRRLNDVTLDMGDALLLYGSAPALARIRREVDFIVTEQAPVESYRTEKIPVALAIVLGVVGLAAAGIPILVTALVGSVLLVLTGCLKMNELHESIRWDVIFLLAGVLPLGLALEQTGGAQLLADWTLGIAGQASYLVLLYLFYGMAMVLTELISNNATVAVMVPVALAGASTLGLPPHGLVLAVMFAASTSFMTPVGYQTNTMIYGPGGYRFLDFLRVGGPLNLLLWAVTPVFIFLMW